MRRGFTKTNKKMDIRLPRKLKILSYYLPSLYIVGGYVRNSLLELPVSDVDLAAEYTVQELATALSNTEFFLKDFNKKLGTEIGRAHV